jgi:hypothetical protein
MNGYSGAVEVMTVVRQPFDRFASETIVVVTGDKYLMPVWLV